MFLVCVAEINERMQPLVTFQTMPDDFTALFAHTFGVVRFDAVQTSFVMTLHRPVPCQCRPGLRGECLPCHLLQAQVSVRSCQRMS